MAVFVGSGVGVDSTTEIGAALEQEARRRQDAMRSLFMYAISGLIGFNGWSSGTGGIPSGIETISIVSMNTCNFRLVSGLDCLRLYQ